MTNLSRHLGTVAVLSLVVSSGAVAQAKGGTDDAHWAKVRRVLRTTPLVDGHNDLPWYIREEVKTAPRDVEAYDLRTRTSGNTDIARLKQGMVGGQFWSVYIPGEVKDSGYARIQLEQIDIAKRIIAKYPDAFSLSLTAADVRRAKAAGKVGSLLGMEGGHALENSLGALRAYYDLGARYLTLTHNVTLDWADAAQDKLLHGGLTKFGEEVVREMNRLGMLVDLSHVSPGTMSDALNVTESPVIFSHSAARALVDVPRNVPDSILQRLPKNGGVVMVAFVPGFTSNKVVAWKQAQGEQAEAALKRHAGDSAAARRDLKEWERTHPFVNATIADVADHIEHIRKVASVNNVGLGSDYDGTGNELPDGLGDVSTFPALLVELSKRGWSESDLRKVAGENVLRVMSENERIAAKLRRQRPASTKTIEELDGPRPKM
ncbi:MAG: dipeptidase [Gemmatimonadetes bacterium]|jgi:membrane dipeptidase|nr:dipeptidase [Gemmatimonadota bacterium]MBK6457447.1 dipeptidase [Gemmatimonadota bacterium]MBK9408728.1 dipeptidase [Gemmatimonadota bacterium]MBK9978093.1 dipeptidase [Gemmatimonadota bacterium]